ncbi:hypothetical protein DPMN_054414 [Dreissena polymorpha]|uniref:Uncharacterized protein n=1 Tax=Dreissena polymorpha TaxID=45954 RepID=A0A9D4HPR1_DREPO|nr:hypothetical protein DPMN_054414 [Dreissena polymorpha]
MFPFIDSIRCYNSGVPLLKKARFGYRGPFIKFKILNDHLSCELTNEDTPITSALNKFRVDLEPPKAQGLYQLPTRLLKENFSELAPDITLLCETSLTQCKIYVDSGDEVDDILLTCRHSTSPPTHIHTSQATPTLLKKIHVLRVL